MPGGVALAVGAGVAAKGAHDAKKKGKKEAKHQKRELQKASGRAGVMGEFGADWLQAFDDIIIGQTLPELASSIRVAPEAYYGAIREDVRRPFEQAQAVQARQQERVGIGPGSPAYQAGQENLRLAMAAAEAGARTSMRRRARGEEYQRRQALMGQGMGLMSGGISALGGAANVHQGVAGAFGQRAQGHFQEAGSLASTALSLGAGAFGAGPLGGRKGGINQGGGSSFQSGPPPQVDPVYNNRYGGALG